MIFQDIIFWLLSITVVIGALGVIFLRNVFRAALMLVLVFLAVAGLFALMHAEFLAVVQVLVYVGAISILIIFAITFTRNVQLGNLPSGIQAPAFLLSSLLLAALVFVSLKTNWPLIENTPVDQEYINNIFSDTPRVLGDLLLKNFALPFEAVSVLLLAALIGALALVRER